MASANNNRVKRLADCLSSSAFILCNEFDLLVKLELIVELKQTFRTIFNELQELDLDEIESDLAERFEDILVTFISSIREEILKSVSQLNSHKYFSPCD